MGCVWKLFGVVWICSLATTNASPAFAAGTTAGSTITNTASVSYQVGGITQNSTSAADTLTVDRTINLTVVKVGTATTTVTPGQLSAATAFTVTNTSNAVLDFALDVAQQTGGTALHGGTDTFDVNNVLIFADTNSNGVYDPGTDVQITYLDEVAADASRMIFVVTDIPLGLANSAVAGVTLTATGRESGAAENLGVALPETTGGNTAGMDTVFADGAGATDVARDAAFSARDDYTVLAATLSVLKSSTIISDPINGTTNPKMIPGATIQYCIAVSNAAGGADATGVTITDTLPDRVTYDSTYGIRLNGTVASGTCQADGAAGGDFTANTVNGTIANLPAGTTRTVLFRVTIN